MKHSHRSRSRLRHLPNGAWRWRLLWDSANPGWGRCSSCFMMTPGSPDSHWISWFRDRRFGKHSMLLGVSRQQPGADETERAWWSASRPICCRTKHECVYLARQAHRFKVVPSPANESVCSRPISSACTISLFGFLSRFFASFFTNSSAVSLHPRPFLSSSC